MSCSPARYSLRRFESDSASVDCHFETGAAATYPARCGRPRAWAWRIDEASLSNERSDKTLRASSASSSASPLAIISASSSSWSWSSRSSDRSSSASFAVPASPLAGYLASPSYHAAPTSFRDGPGTGRSARSMSLMRRGAARSPSSGAVCLLMDVGASRVGEACEGCRSEAAQAAADCGPPRSEARQRRIEVAARRREKVAEESGACADEEGCSARR